MEQTRERPRPTSETAGGKPSHAPREAIPKGGGYAWKRVLLGPALPTSDLAHERLGKVTALAIFSSDALSSVAYATEEMLRTLFAAGVIAAAAFALLMPLSFVIVGVLAILMFSYRQTIRAYPSAGGAYIVTKDNFGLIPAQVAGVALLTDYVLTVAVSVSSGVAAIIAAAPSLAELRVPMALFFITVIALGNLRGVKESGRIFAAPTYLFIAGVFTLLAIGVGRLLTGSLHPIASPAYVSQWARTHATAGVGALAVVPIFLVLHALASGSAAMTGVEAISNGVPAFKPPEWRNARATLMWMGAILGTMFLGISFLAHRLQVVPDPSEKSTVIADIARALFGSSGAGHVLFYGFQVATTLILVLAANTAFADFPRLANFHAGDNFLPRQFTTRGHRLVFSNGIIALGAVAAAMVIAFDADVTRLIPFYAIGVFTSFTLSQAGMARRHLRLKEPGWKHGFAINAAGAVATGVVDSVIAVTKFTHGAWAVVVMVPVLVFLLTRMNRQYEQEAKELDHDLQRFSAKDLRRPLTVVLVDDVDHKTIHALQYAKTIRAEDVIAVHIERDRTWTTQLQQKWSDARLGDGFPLSTLRGEGDEPTRLAGFAGSLPVDREVNLIIPVPVDHSLRERLSGRRIETRIARALLPYEQVRVTLVRDHEDGVHPLVVDEEGRPQVRFLPRGQHEVVIPVDKIDRAFLRAVRYALTLGATEVRAVHAGVDPHRAEELVATWMGSGLPIPLDVVQCWDRDVPRAVERFTLELSRPGVEVTVVLPRRDYPKLRQRLLHDRTSRAISRNLGRYPHVDVAAVPYYVDPVPERPPVAVAAGTPGAR
ncbi:MAG: APC family permease [Actinobacteria bacterium]|nr:APC family permease [Actinomycetota bacterium]